jgi:hypothetical protein
MNNNVSKPMSLATSDFEAVLTNVINNCGLPPFIVEMALKNIYLEVKALSQKQYEREREQYERELEEHSSCLEGEE